ncbi:MAG: D-2-hydroxyacid dehydrogenase [Chloroflexi bacterium]|nr:D-2-hydroxyacid dehydrogenase [Chloroflexota bacterium]
MSVTILFWPPWRRGQEDWARRVDEALPDVRTLSPEDTESALDVIGEADAIFAESRISEEALAAATKVRWIHSAMVAPPPGWYHDALIEHPATVTNPRGVYNDHISVHIMSFVLHFARQLHRYVRSMAGARWEPDLSRGGVTYLEEATALLIGVGEIGAETARLLAAFGVNVVGVDARRTELIEGLAALHPPEALDELLPDADFVILTVPHTPETEGMMNAARFEAMKDTAYLINIGRGPTVRLDDLDAALRSGTIGGAGLDVYEIEPLPQEHPLWSAPNVLLTPHVAAHGPYVEERRFQVLLENCRRFAAGEPLENIVDKARWF